ncbi:hypothetical protein F01_190034 [Burkholderia cenocepacia]|nr:hypothetical protein F01_190034 [Burkholderia cenocepacia]
MSRYCGVMVIKAGDVHDPVSRFDRPRMALRRAASARNATAHRVARPAVSQYAGRAERRALGDLQWRNMVGHAAPLPVVSNMPSPLQGVARNGYADERDA